MPVKWPNRQKNGERCLKYVVTEKETIRVDPMRKLKNNMHETQQEDSKRKKESKYCGRQHEGQ